MIIKDEFLERYRNDVFSGNCEDHQKEELRLAGFFYDLVSGRYEPLDKNFSMHRTHKSRFSQNSRRFEDVLKILGGNQVENIMDADTSIYWGLEYLCEFKKPSDFPDYVIEPVLLRAEQGKTALIFYNGKQSDEFCFPHCWPGDKIRELERDRKDVIRVPLGLPYQKVNP